jgi:predicted nuclease of restriction endonuclease-like (RecB) superfamily
MKNKNNSIEIKNTEYLDLITELKSKIQVSQIKAHIKVNEELLKLYWEIGRIIVEKQKISSWGDGIIKQISKDLQTHFPNMKGFSITNIKYMKKWFIFYASLKICDKNSNITKSPQLVDEFNYCDIFYVPWGHNREIITKCKSLDEAIYYIQQTIKNNLSRVQLIEKIKKNDFLSVGKSYNNFKDKLPDIHSKLAIETLKNPYNFDFLSLREDYDERELEDALIDNITHFLLELGQGFAFVGRQYKLLVGNKNFKIDLLFYHIILHSYVVVELKTVDFQPEFAGKLNFYVSAVDGELKGVNDNPTIGLLICKSKNKTIVEYSFKDINKPIGISEYELTNTLPNKFKSTLPTIEEIENELGNSYEK